MSGEEREEQRIDEEKPDVEGHMHKHRRNDDEGKKEPEDKGNDDPDVEAHMHKHR
jgi:hypothetical protein